jgi:hypothetical protein
MVAENKNKSLNRLKTTNMGGLIKLVHPRLGVCAEAEYGLIPQYRIEKKWKGMYGKKFYECEVVLEDTPPPRKYLARRAIINNKTGERYQTLKEAATALETTPNTLKNHLNKTVYPRHTGGKYLVSWE